MKISKFVPWNELYTIVRPSGEKLAHPSIDGVLRALLDPGKASRLTGVVQLPQFFAMAVALISVVKATAPDANERFDFTLFMLCSAHSMTGIGVVFRLAQRR
jgi:hypothetical protein